MLNPKTKLTNNEHAGYKDSIITNNEKYLMKKPQIIRCKAELKNAETFSVNLWKAENQKKTITTVKKISPAENCCFSMTRRRCRSASPPAASDVFAKIPPTTKMQTLRAENLTRCKKLLRCNGYPNKVSFFILLIQWKSLSPRDNEFLRA